MTNYLFNLPNDLLEVIYFKKHKMEWGEVCNEINEERAEYCEKCGEECSYNQIRYNNDITEKTTIICEDCPFNTNGHTELEYSPYSGEWVFDVEDTLGLNGYC